MPFGRLPRVPSLQRVIQAWPWWLLLLALVGVRLSKGAFLTDAYALVSRPFWPGTAQREWLQSAQQLDQRSRLAQLEQDNRRLRTLLGLQRANPQEVTAAVISREPEGWWKQLVLGAGELQGIRRGDAVVGPGGLVGRVASVTPTTARVALLTDSSSRIGVWVGRTQSMGLLTGVNGSRPELRFLVKDPQVRPGDVVVTSPASTLVPPGMSVGVIQSVDEKAVPAPTAVVQLSAPVEAIDWVQVLVQPRQAAP
ncbi:MAG: rod shape-determining protein MreC [Cyanobium sp.]|uniref:rod shape-determining protein MreC n=1 Tax=unclassified Synechococcus TaxID=2626047 RepID=UPI000DBBD9B6|nr:MULTISPECIES: rod shape-determining protein MreC [unclassified Synechococcus]MCP9828444.1 rod shape-determining protein MreC [Synechococcus sp. L2F]MCP9847958.1 rod shape-determining protein MreC [Synechococcus sp. Lug-A]MCT0210404.1 rod shape-determining protein MreC [Synechococcus sp. CS-1333]PZV24382.1 MAG: rod shape-determining protein MreC [Cyanobium sp.]